MTSGYSVESIFTALNPRGTETLPIQEFAENISIYCHMNLRDALALGNRFDTKRRQCISAEDIRLVLSKKKGLTSVNSLLKGHPLFPDWLVTRTDFQHYFNEWGAENGVPNTGLIEAALLLEPANRKAGDLQVLYKWIKLHKILVHVRDSRLLDVCQNIQLIDCPRLGMKIFEQGDTGDAFYIVIDGLLDVRVNGTSVGNMNSGEAFGEKALENNAPRAASVITLRPSKLMVLRASEYKNLVLSAQAKANQEIVEFLHSRCAFFNKVSYARLYYMVKVMIRRTYQPNERIQIQGENAGCVFVIMSGKVAITKHIQEDISDSENKSPLSSPSRPRSKASSRYAPPTLTTVVHIGDISMGQIFGDEAASDDLISYSYGAVSKSRTEIILINRKEVLSYFHDKILRPDLLVSDTLLFHADDAILIQKHFTSLKKHQYMKDLKNAALSPTYAGKMRTSHGIQDSRSLSTKSLEGQIAKVMATQAQAKYQRVAITATMDVQARAAVSTRRASCISFLTGPLKMG